MSSTIQSYKDLLVWKKGMLIVRETYLLALKFPKEEMFALTNQIKRASVSIPSNKAEGYGREYTNSYINHLRISRGSLFELETQVEIAVMLEFVTALEAEPLFSLIIEESKMLTSLIKKLKPE